MGFDLAADFLVHRSDAELPTARGLLQTQDDQKGGLGSFTCDLFKLFKEQRDSTSFWCNWKSKTEKRSGHFDGAPNLIPATSGFGGESNHTVFAKCAFDACHALPQLVVRQLIGFRGNY